jgi:predicted amino acid dehydrogenase
MDRQPSSLDFAIIGHQDSWKNVSDFINGVRAADMAALSDTQVRDIFPYIPPRDLFRIKVRSSQGKEINGSYIETFIPPDKLNGNNAMSNIAKVKKAISFARKLDAGIVTLGGFTSILIEGNVEESISSNTMFTTGNTLTAAFIVKGIEAAAKKLNIRLSECVLMVAGATGDIGLACTKYFSRRVSTMLLNARNYNRLQSLCGSLREEGVDAHCSTVINELIPEADVIIYVTSSANMQFANGKKNVLVCDAGYPKNIEPPGNTCIHLFHGGMGLVENGYSFIPDYSGSFYRYPEEYICHGCVLEAIVLAFEGRFEPYSTGKGNITETKMEEIFGMAQRHGIGLAPFYNHIGKW